MLVETSNRLFGEYPEKLTQGILGTTPGEIPCETYKKFSKTLGGTLGGIVGRTPEGFSAKIPELILGGATTRSLKGTTQGDSTQENPQ